MPLDPPRSYMREVMSIAIESWPDHPNFAAPGLSNASSGLYIIFYITQVL